MIRDSDRILLPFDTQVCMVWHQAVSIKIERPFYFLLRDQVGELEVVVVRSKDLVDYYPG